MERSFAGWEKENLVLSTGLIMWIGHRKEIRKLTFRALALRRSPVDKTKLPCYTSHRRSTTVSLETYPYIERKRDRAYPSLGVVEST